jgi:RimJ/RimL family protein N-acetyltransferase
MPNSIKSIVTPRLVALPLSEAHFPEINRLHSDPQVMKTLSADGKPLSEEKTWEHIRQTVDHWERHGFGLWIFRSKATGEFIGRGGLKIHQIGGKDVIGLAYAVMPDHWSQGYATEMAQVSLEVGFGQLGFPEIDS